MRTTISNCEKRIKNLEASVTDHFELLFNKIEKIEKFAKDKTASLNENFKQAKAIVDPWVSVDTMFIAQ